MNISESWILSFDKKFTKKSLDISSTFTNGGLEVEDTFSRTYFENIKVGLIDSLNKITPSLIEVNISLKKKKLKVICSDLSIKNGDLVPVAIKGSIIGKTTIEEKKVKNFISQGMLCSEFELGLGNDSKKVLRLSPLEFSLGDDIWNKLALSKNIFSFKITANRGDCLSAYGLYRELCALTNTNTKNYDLTEISPDLNINKKINIENFNDCRSYNYIIIKNLNNKISTPLYIKNKLHESGINSINFIVDITNFVMLDMGQPLHAFDLTKINGNLNIRRAKKTEKIKLLNDKLLNLNKDYLVIADDKQPIALAGIMGGKNSMIDHNTSNVLLESANFSPSVLKGKWRKLGFSSDALHRFEREVDLNMTANALKKCVEIIRKFCEIETSKIITSKKESTKKYRKKIKLSYKKVREILGENFVSIPRIKTIFEILNFKIVEQSSSFISIQAPSYRTDIEIEEDLIEEISRINGFNHLKTESINSKIVFSNPYKNPFYNQDKVRNSFLNRNFNEILNLSFNSESDIKNFDSLELIPIKIKNPISDTQSFLRVSILPGLLNTAVFNFNRQVENIRLFEIGNVFSKNQSKFSNEKCSFAALISGSNSFDTWTPKKIEYDFYDLKGDLEFVFPKQKFEYRRNEKYSFYNKDISALIFLKNKEIGHIGKLSNDFEIKYGLKNTFVFEIFYNNQFSIDNWNFKEFSKQPLIKRDINFVTSKNLRIQEITNYIESLKVINLYKISHIDFYESDAFADKKKSLTFRFTFYSDKDMLTEESVDTSIKLILNKVTSYFNINVR